LAFEYRNSTAKDQQKEATMAQSRHYSPRISRFLVSVLYHEAQRRQVPMTKLTDDLLRQQLVGCPSWDDAQGMRVAEEPPEYPASTR